MAKICYGCMNIIENSEKECPYCHFYLPSYRGIESALLPGTVLNNKYLVGRTLGKGGFGITYIARDMNLQTKIAIKEFYPATLVNRNKNVSKEITIQTDTRNGIQDFQQGMKRYIREAEILSNFFNLPGIVSVKDFFYENGTAYIVMEYVDGISLKDYLESKGTVLSVEETLTIMKPILASLDIIHQSNVLHRDISPDNIMISKSGEVKLIDFGAAREYTNDGENSMTVVVKRGYAPVEQYSRNGEQGVWTDIYGICATMYRMLTGEVPSESIDQVLTGESRSIKKINREIPKYVAAAIMKGLSLKAEDRQQSVKELYDDLYHVETYQKKRNNNIVKILTEILVGLVIMIGIGIFLIYRFESVPALDQEERLSETMMEEETQKNDSEDGMSTAVEPKEGQENKENIQENSDENNSTSEMGQDNKTKQNMASELESTATESVEEPVTVVDQRNEILEHGILVCREGTFDNISKTMKVGEMFDRYSDIPGSWNAEEDEAGNLYTYYSGSKNGESFIIRFQVFDNDTFKIIGAKKNGTELTDYNTYVQEILNSIGL